jgi:hypothetical protein
MNYQQFLTLVNQLQPNVVIQTPDPTEAYFNSLSPSQRLAIQKQITIIVNLQNGIS